MESEKAAHKPHSEERRARYKKSLLARTERSRQLKSGDIGHGRWLEEEPTERKVEVALDRRACRLEMICELCLWLGQTLKMSHFTKRVQLSSKGYQDGAIMFQAPQNNFRELQSISCRSSLGPDGTMLTSYWAIVSIFCVICSSLCAVEGYQDTNGEV